MYKTDTQKPVCILYTSLLVPRGGAAVREVKVLKTIFYSKVGSENKILFTSLKELREKQKHLVLWAQNVCNTKEREYTKEQIQLDLLHDEKKIFTNLARFYLKEGTSDFERWHNKLGHV